MCSYTKTGLRYHGVAFDYKPRIEQNCDYDGDESLSANTRSLPHVDLDLDLDVDLDRLGRRELSQDGCNE